jgi:hypothetical protein
MTTIVPFAQQHPTYAMYSDRWARCRDTAEGTDAVKTAGVKYLPKLRGQSNDEYNAYKERALYVNVVGRTLNSLTGLVTSRSPEITIPDELQSRIQDVDNRGTQFPQLLRWTVNDVLLVGRLGLLVDFPPSGGEGYITTYSAENIINWGIDNDTYQLNMVMLQEFLYEPTTSPVSGIPSGPAMQFALQSVTRIRVLFLDKDGVYRQHVYKQKSIGINSQPVSLELEHEIMPVVRDEPLDFIPFTFITPFGIDTQVYKPPMLDIADINLSHYRSSADLEHGRHYTALPVPVVSGIETDKDLKIGSDTAWILPDKEAKAYYLEFKGEGLKSLETALKEKMDQMAVFSTRLMDNSTRGSESPDSVRIRQSSDAVTLVTS